MFVGFIRIKRMIIFNCQSRPLLFFQYADQFHHASEKNTVLMWKQ